ncbi:hypothetical protein [Bradyrhizobium sp. Gha]|uniref:hypothetical protein n=1 Tax=Bradyrhizobium sp. Gha TaxID=1855318 RepID=UPI001FCE171A|nr:hypothetical protein [Bradyrhizobium sp. Gha]
MIDGEAVVRGVDGISDFNALHSRKHDHEVQFCAFDILAEGADDLRMLPLTMRVSSGLSNGLGGDRLETPRAAVSGRPVQALDQG